MLAISNIKASSSVQKTEEKSKIKKWPSNKYQLLPYKNIVGPIKSIILKGYRLLRRDEITSFDYDGYDFGHHESQPSPNQRFSKDFIEKEKKEGHTLIDIALNAMFLLGIEQGRRAERKDIRPIEELLSVLSNYRETNKNLRFKIDKLEIINELNQEFPNISTENFQELFDVRMEIRKKARIEELKTELSLDPSRSNFNIKTITRTKFRELEKIANIFIEKKKCTLGQWQIILREHGWSTKDWQDTCNKKSIDLKFLP